MEYSTREKNIWIELILNLFVSLYYFTAIYQLNGWEEITGDEIGYVIRNVIVFAIIGTILLHTIFVKNYNEQPKDERDIAIEAKGNATGYYTLVILCTLLIAHIMLNEGVGFLFSERTVPFTGPFAMHLILIAIMIASFSKSIVQITCYRRGS